MNDKARQAAYQCCDGKQVVLLFEKTGKTDKSIGDRIVKDDGNPADCKTGSQDILQRTEDKAGTDAPSQAPADSKNNQGNHDEVDASAESAEPGHDRDLQVTQGKGERDTDAAFCQAADGRLLTVQRHVLFLQHNNRFRLASIQKSHML